MPSATETLVLFEAPKVHVFSLPPSDFLKSDNWDGNYIWSGALKVIREGHFFAVRLVEKDTNELFGECPIRDNNNNNNNANSSTASASASASGSSDGSSSESVQPATDSTRAFVLRVEEGDQFSYVGLLFDDRTVAYNFSSALIHRRKGLGPAPVLPVQDHTLAKDESITVDLFNKVKTGYKDQEAAATTSSSSSTTVVGNSHFGGEIPRVDLFSLEITTKGKGRRVKCDSNEILAADGSGGPSSPSSSTEAAAEQVSRGNSSNNSQSQKQASPTSSSSIDDIFGGGGSSSKPPQQQQQKQQPSKSSADALDDVFSGGNTNQQQQQQQQSSSKQKDVLDALFG